MSFRSQMAALAWVLTACAPAEDPPPQNTPDFDDEVVRLSPDQRAECDALRQQAQPTPWWCGGRVADPPPPFAQACGDHEWVGYRLQAGDCPPASSEAGRWSIEVPHARSQSARLRRFCRYSWRPDNANAPDVAALPDLASLRLERDCDVVSGHGAPHALPSTDLMFKAWQSQLELPDWSAAEPFETAPIRVAIIDGGFGGVQGPRAPAAPSVPHPVAVGSAVRAVACPERGRVLCSAGTPNYSAMPYFARGRLGELGGFFGTQSRYAQAVTDAVDDWLAEPPDTRPRGLILNLSLGWDSAYDASVVQRLPGLEALWATEYAACHGALLIAAAGNLATGTDQGPVFPAAYAKRARECGADPDVPQPLVHAVGGVDGRDRPLAISRPGSLPRLLAPAALVVVPQDTIAGLDDPTAVMSGSSMAAAAVSGAAALIWGMRPDTAPDQIMETLYQAGEPLGAPAQVGFGPLAEQRRLSIARAFALACPAGFEGGRCPPEASRPRLPGPRPYGEDARVDFQAVARTRFPHPIAVDPHDAVVEQPLAPSLYFNPWSVPQPATPNCPVCGVTDARIIGMLSRAVREQVIGLPVLIYEDERGEQNTITLDPLPANAPFVVDLGPKLDGVTPRRARLEVRTDLGGKTVLTSSEIAVD